jgi:cell division protein FtsZ
LKNAEKGIDEMRKCIDTLIVIPNDRIFSIIEKNTPAISAFKVIDSILLEATRSISDLINNHGYINLDFADIRTVMLGMGDALMGTGMATGDNRSSAAAEEAISSPLLDGVDINGALGVLINITGGSNLTLWEVNEAATIIQEAAGSKVNVIFGMVVDEGLSDELRVTVIATGFNKEAKIKNQLETPKSVPKSFEPVDFSELDKPAFIRKHKDEKKIDSELPATSRPQKTNVYHIEDEDIPDAPDELDTPTFLRKQMD